jgi:putative metallohydrolase (TIGR04338 family)
MARSGLRDTQRSRVYEWERAVIKERGVGFYDAEFETLEECEQFMNPIWRKERGRLGLARQRAPELSRNLWGQRSAWAGDNHVIKLPKWARSRWVILHEMAHRLTSSDPGHGARFVGCLMGLVARHLEHDVNDLMRVADEHRVKYHVRTIGVVPVLGPSWHVERALREQPPMTAMDLACWLSLGCGLRITVTQVRGAALPLIRQGKARWLRSKLVPLEREVTP